MAIKQVEMNVKTDSGYDALHPKTDSEIVNYDNSSSGLSATNVKSAIDEVKAKTYANISKNNKQVDVVPNKTIAPSAWTADTAESDFKFKADIVISGLLPTDSVTVDFNRANAESGNLSTYAFEQNGKVTIYAKEQPTENVVIDKITINRKVVL